MDPFHHLHALRCLGADAQAFVGSWLNQLKRLVLLSQRGPIQEVHPAVP